jgi:hypothetical protein
MKDKIAGYSIFLLSLAVLGTWLTFTIWGIIDWGTTNPFIPERITIILIASPIILGMLIVLSIAAWIGWTMARTPPPAPIALDDFENEELSEEEK